MRKPKWDEIVVMMFALYMWFTLTVEPNLFSSGRTEQAENVYSTYISMVGSQQNLAWISLTVSALYFLILFTSRFSILLTVHIAGLIYYFFITASFLLNYPNIAFGVMSLVSIALFQEILKLIDESEERKKEKILNNEDTTEGGEHND